MAAYESAALLIVFESGENGSRESPLRVEKGTTTRKIPHRAFTRAGETNRMNKTAGVNEQVGPSWPGSPNFANGIVALS